MSDNERNRVQALLDEGRISEDEAEILFAALEESAPEAPAPTSLQAVAPRRADTEALPTPPAPPPPAEASPPLPPDPTRDTASDASDSALDPRTWVKLTGFCGDLSVCSDPHISSPVIDGNALLEHTETGYLIRTPPESKGGNWLQRLHKAAGDVRIRLPAEMGLDLGIMAGDGEVRDVKAIRGTFTGGDFEVAGAETVDLTVTAGDVTLKLRPRTGAQRLKAISGDVDVIFLAGTSATVSGSATCGDLDLPESFRRNGGFANHKFDGTLGAGEARLELLLTAGDVTIRAEDA